MKTHSYPAWFYGPNGAREIFNSDEEVPAGWHDHPSKVPASTKPVPPVVAKENAGSEKQPVTASADLDAAGWPFDPSLHAATRTKTKDGLWRMKVGVSRPAPKQVEKLDL